MRAEAPQQHRSSQVNFYPSRHPDPRKARKKDIKQARALLKPSKRSILTLFVELVSSIDTTRAQAHVLSTDATVRS